MSLISVHIAETLLSFGKNIPTDRPPLWRADGNEIKPDELGLLSGGRLDSTTATLFVNYSGPPSTSAFAVPAS